MPKLEITGTALDYDEVGVGDTVVFVHGTLGSKDAWELQVPAFAERYRTIVYTRRHHFGSQREGDTLPLSPAQAALDLIELIELIGKPPVHLVGSSYGAFASLLATVARPDLIRTLTLGEPPAASLLLEDPATAPMWKDFVERAYYPAQALAKSGDRRGAIATFVSGVIGPGVFDSMPAVAQERMLRNGLTLAIEESPEQALNEDDWRRVSMPVLLVGGANTMPMFAPITERLQKRLPHAENVVIPKAGHAMNAMNPGFYNREVLAFLDRN